MAYKVAIDSSNKRLDDEDYTLLISKYISERLGTLGIDNFLVRSNSNDLTDEERVNIIKNKYGNGNNIIVISNRLDSGSISSPEIVYALRNNSRLSSSLANNLSNIGLKISKYYQLRNPSNTALDDDYLINNTKNNQTLLIYLGNENSNDDINFIKNNYEKIGEAIVKSIANYAGVSYYPVNDNYYVVQKGDSLWSISSKLGVSVSDIKKINNLSSNNLSIGQVLIIPSKKSDDEESNADENIYVVKKGDSLWLIAKNYNTSVDEIKRLNNLSSNTLSIGQKLKIPNAITSNEITYTVKKGDSLWLIANKYDTTVNAIKDKNGLTSNNLSIGQILKIPSTTNYITYTVKKGDSLWLIAKNYNTSVNDIKKLNSLSSNNLSIGQKLIIPG